MPYLMLIHETRGDRARRQPAEGEQLYEAMMGYAADLQARGVLLRAESLRTDDHAVRLSARNGATETVDGPFAEAKEMVGGFFLLDVATRDAAVALARECPALAWATVEVRECAPCHEL